MTGTGNKAILRPRLVKIFAILGWAILAAMPVQAARIHKTFSTNTDGGEIDTGFGPIAAGSDSVLCDGGLLRRDLDYTINIHTGQVALTVVPPCDSVTVIALRLPEWLTEEAGNPVPQGKRFITLKTDLIERPRGDPGTRQKFTLAGNKSFSFSVGRSGEGTFSQGLNIDFDAILATDLRLRGSVSDRIGASEGLVAGSGGTTILSELDKYFFEIEGTRVTARGGDIEIAASEYLPRKRIRGIYGAYADDHVDIGADIGRPPGRFVSRKINGIDSRQGPYQMTGGSGRPVGVVPGTEKVFVDGQLLEGGTDRHYVIDYPSGRITFSPRILITSRSRIEVDFEAADTDYEQAVLGLSTGIKLWGDKLVLRAGGRRETDEEDRLRFGSLSPDEIDILGQAGDSSSQAMRDGATADTSGAYVQEVDTSGHQYYRYVGAGNGDYSVSFSFVGERLGEYLYVGEGVYQYAGSGGGDYLPQVYLPLPVRNEYVFGALEFSPYNEGSVRFTYRGNARDNNLLSDRDDGDNFNSALEGIVSHAGKTFISTSTVRFRQEQYDPTYRLDAVDDGRLWAIPGERQPGDEMRFSTDNAWKNEGNMAEAGFGYLGYKDNLRSYRFRAAMRLFQYSRLSPRVEYRSANAERVDDTEREGLYERYGGGLSVAAVRSLRFDIGYDRELIEDRFEAVPTVQRYAEYRGSSFWRNTVVTVSRRIDYTSDTLGTKGPRLDKVQVISEENIGRLKMVLAGTWLEQKRLDSDRDDRTERLFSTSFRYTGGGGWLALQAEYRQNRQSARSFGYRYIQVGSGEGDYRFEDGQYLPDPDGDYVRIREERGTATSVSVGGKNHSITFYPGRIRPLSRYRSVLSQVAVQVRTEVVEEMPGKDRRMLSWVLPWASRSGIEYISRLRRQAYSLFLFPTFNFYVLNFSFNESFEEQESGGLLYRDSKEYLTEVKNSLSEQVRSSLEWRHRRVTESGAALVSLRLRSDDIGAGLAVNQGMFRVSPRLSYTRFIDDLSGGEGRGVVSGLEAVLRRPNRGEVRLDVEVRSLTEKKAFSQPEYLVTNGRRFGKSGQLAMVANYDLGRSMRLTVNLTDRIYEGRSAEFTGRGELVARF